MRASLPMYDLPEVRDHTDRLWTAIAEELHGLGVADVPDMLERPADHHDAWRPPGLRSRNRAAIPSATALRDVVRVVATPHYAAIGCDGPRYRSAVVVRASSRAASLDDLRGTVCAFNAGDSHSGYNALRAAVAPIANGRPFFSTTIGTGAHAASIAVVRDRRCRRLCGRLRDVGRCSPATARRRCPGSRCWRIPSRRRGCRSSPAGDCSDATVETIRNALDRAFSRPDLADTRAALLIGGLSVSTLDTYAPLLEMERAAVALGYPDLE